MSSRTKKRATPARGSYQKRYKKLDAGQKMAVDYIDGPLLIIAGPGTGKTEVLGLRAGNILKKTDVPPESILCLTYTEAASSNMRERLIDLMGEDGYRISVHTFHGFCQKIIESYPEYFFKSAFFNVADEAVKTEFLEEIISKLNHTDPFAGKHPKEGYIHLKNIKEAIENIKKSGLTSQEFGALLKENKAFLRKTKKRVNEIFGQRVQKGLIPEIRRFLREIENEEKAPGRARSLSSTVFFSLSLALEADGTEKISLWKKRWTRKMGKKTVLKDLYKIERVESLANIYEKYEKKMQREGYYDFQDMLIGAVLEIEKNESLRSDLKEKYLYFLADEFQDTNGVQMRILNSLTKEDVDEKPNLCVVGDDDQAIYRFQGAEISNILDFKRNYPKAKVITLNRNYRSKREIISAARGVIVKGEERLENLMPGIRKDFFPEREGKGSVSYYLFGKKEEEFTFLAREIKREIKKGKKPPDIAVIGRRHKTLKEAEPFLASLNVPFYSERKDNVLEKEHVRQLITLVRFAVCFPDEREKAEQLLPEILSFPFWKIKREKIIEMSLRAYEKRKSWIWCFRNEKGLKSAAEFLTNLSLKAKHKSLEEIIEMIISGLFKEYYFSEEMLKKNTGKYLDFLSSLLFFTEQVKDYKKGKFIKAKDLINFVEIHEKNEIPLLNKNPLTLDDKSISLITAHGAKGKEFDIVFVINSNKEEWDEKRGGRGVTLPGNLPFQPAGDEKDDRLRLFYVALSRARDSLFFLSHEKKEDGRKASPLEFLEGVGGRKKTEEADVKAIESSLFYAPPFNRKEAGLLKSFVRDYKISPTGLNKFLDVTDYGPRVFLEENILRFPRKKTPSLSYGTAVHRTIKEIYVEIRKGKRFPSKTKIMKLFKEYLKKERLPEEEFKKLLKQGEEEVTYFCREKKEDFSPHHLIEKDFQGEDCFLGETKITGKIDKIVQEGREVRVFDLKTGKPLSGWKGKTKHEKINAWRYRNQLIFYKILIDSSKKFKKKNFVKEGYLEFLKPGDDGRIATLPLEIEKGEEERVKAIIEAVGQKIRKNDFPCIKKYKKFGFKGIKMFEEDLIKRKI